jgi:hypothetical protein
MTARSLAIIVRRNGLSGEPLLGSRLIPCVRPYPNPDKCAIFQPRRVCSPQGSLPVGRPPLMKAGALCRPSH